MTCLQNIHQGYTNHVNMDNLYNGTHYYCKKFVKSRKSRKSKSYKHYKYKKIGKTQKRKV
jgi:hypothetical protein